MADKSKIIVNADFYGGSQGIDNILNDYYEREIRNIGNASEQKLVRKFIEEGLIIDGSRVSVSEGAAINQFDLSEELLDRLRNSRLIRAENTHLGKAYEVSHDTLVAPIFKSFEKRKRLEEQQELARKLNEERRAFEKEKKKKRRANGLAALGFLLFFITCFALCKAIQLNNEAKQQTRIARANELTAYSVFETEKKQNVTEGYGLIKAALDFDDNIKIAKELFQVYFKASNDPAHFFYVQNLDCEKSMLLSAYYSPQGNYILINAWNNKSCLLKNDGTFIRKFEISTLKPRKRVFFSNDESFLIVLSKKGQAEVYTLEGINENSKPVAILEGHQGNIIMASISTDGEKILTCTDDGVARLWNTNWKLEKTISEANHKIHYANFSPDRSKILTVNQDGDFQIRNDKGELMHRIKNQKGSTRVIAISPSSNYFAIASPTNKAIVWDWEGQQIGELVGHKSYVNDMTWSPDGEKIVTSSLDKRAKIWDVTGTLLADIKGHDAGILSVDFAPDGERVLTSSIDNTIKVWRMYQGQEATLSGHFEKVTSAMFHPKNGRILSFSEEDETVKEWAHVENGVIDFGGQSKEVYGCEFSNDGKIIITGGSDMSMLWDASNYREREIKLSTKLIGHQTGVIHVAFSPNENFVATSSYDHTARVWDFAGGQKADFTEHKALIRTVEWSPDGQQLVTASYDNTAKVWQKDGGPSLFTLTAHTEPVMFAAFTPDGKYIITTSADHTVKIWDRKGKLIKSLEEHQSLVVDAALSPDSKYLVTASEDQTAIIWSLEKESDFKKIAVLKGHENKLVTVNVSPDGKYIVTTSEGNTALVWNSKGELIAELSGHGSRLQKAIFSHNGKLIATASSDNTAKIWDLRGNLISDLIGHKNTVNDINFSLDDKWLLTASSDGLAKLWPITTKDEIIQRLDAIGVQGLAEENKEQYGLK